METEKDKMLIGELYDPNDPQLAADRKTARALCVKLNSLDPAEAFAKKQLLSALFGQRIDADITPPFHCDYGYNLKLSAGTYINCNCVFLDIVRIVVGKGTIIGPGVHVYTALHPMNPEERKTGREYAKPVTIGSNVWIGGGVIVCPGVTIGDDAVVGAGSVVTRDVPARTFAAGNPCRVIREI